MTLGEKILALYPELKYEDFVPNTGTILLQNNSDGAGDFIAKWEHPTLEKPTQNQLDTVTGV